MLFNPTIETMPLSKLRHLSSDDLNVVQGFFSKKIKDNIGLSMKINVLKVGDIPRSEGGKLSRIVDLRKIL